MVQSLVRFPVLSKFLKLRGGQMAISVNYGTHFPWNRPNPNAPSSNRPFAEVLLHGPAPQPVRLWCLVDSGADRIQLNRQHAQAAGLSLAGASTKSMRTAGGGTVTVDVLTQVSLTIEGTSSTDTCYFGNNSTPILGRVTFLNAFNVGFDKKGWMRS